MNHISRRHFLGATSVSLGAVALNELLAADGTQPPITHFAPKAKRAIYLFQSGAPSQIDLFDHKPLLKDRFGQDLPDSIRQGQRLTGMTAGQSKFPIAPSMYEFRQYGNSGATVSELLPHLSQKVDDICFVKSVFTEAINHDPAITFITTGVQLAGRPSLGAWLSYGLGSENKDLPAFTAMVSRGTGRPLDQPLYDRLWGSGFLPSRHQGVKLRSGGDPVLYLSNPPGIDPSLRRQMLDDQAALNRKHHAILGDPDIENRIAQYELAYRMQSAVPELADLATEPKHILEMYGPDVEKPNSFAANCLMARRLVERGVRFVQLFHMGWDHHLKLPEAIRGQCRDVDQPCAALLTDLKRSGLLEDTLVIWGGEFGRTVYCQGHLTTEDYGRDHHPRCFTMWLAGAGIQPGMTYGETDEYSYNIARDPVHVHDLNATLLYCLGVDHKQLTYKFQGRHYRLTDVHGEVVRGILA